MPQTSRLDPLAGQYRSITGQFASGNGQLMSATFTSLAPARMRLAEAVAKIQVEMREMLLAAGLPLETRWKELVLERAYRSGRYYDSIHTEVDDNFNIIVGSDAVNDDGDPYPIYLEYGTQYMAARPTWRPAIDEASPEAHAQAELVWFKFMGGI